MTKELESLETQVSMTEDNVPQDSLQTAGWTVGRKLLLSFGIQLLSLAVIVAIGIYVTITVQGSFDKVIQDTLIELKALGEIEALSLEYERELYEYFLHGEEGDLEQMATAAAQLRERVASYASVGQKVEKEEEHESEQKIADALQEEVTAFLTSAERVVALYREGADIEELTEAGEQLEKVEQSLETALGKAKEDLGEELDEINAAVNTLLTGMEVAVVVFPLGTLLLTVVAFSLQRSVTSSVRHLTETVQRITAGDLQQVVDISSKDEIGVLAQAFNNMTAHLNSLLQREQEQRQQMEEKIQTIQTQQNAIQELSTPVIPVMDRIIVMPLVGNIDTMRARDITRTLLQGIRDHQAKVVILDITGVPIVDTGVASHLNKTIQAARLKGARTIVTGISDAVAETIVDLGIDWGEIETMRDLQTGISAALGGKGIKSQASPQ